MMFIQFIQLTIKPIPKATASEFPPLGNPDIPTLNPHGMIKKTILLGSCLV